MSQKITAKNLSYNAAPPPFLAALQAQASGSSFPDPILAGRRRPVKPRSGSAEAEDAPVVVDEQGRNVDLTVGADGTVRPGDGLDKESSLAAEQKLTDEKTREGEKIAGIGTSKKRKAGKVVGSAVGEEQHKPGAVQKSGASKSEQEKASRSGKTSKDGDKIKKAKKLKLSFDEDGD